MSWIPVSAESHFPIQNLPFGIFSVLSKPSWPRPGVAIGDFVVDLNSLHLEGLLDNLGFPSHILSESTLNSFMGLERKHWRATRSRLQDLLSIDNTDTRLSSNEELKARTLVPMEDVVMHLPATIGDYTDFYSSREHATNVGIMFRGKDNALQPNWLHLPVGYHGRASSVVVSGSDVVRPNGQLQADKDDASKGSTYGPCRLLDYELEMAFFVGGQANPLGRPLTMAEAEDRIFGVVVMNDWSARDIQVWEYVPLGPFTAKNFATSVSPWVVTLDALEDFRCATSAGEAQTNPEPLPYLQDPEYGRSSYNVRLEVQIQGPQDTTPSTVSVSNLKYMYWNFKQQLVHHSVTGCNMNPGDLLGTGTISGPTDDSLGSLLEGSWRGTREVPLANSTETPAMRKFLKDGDTVIMSGYAQGEGYRVGFGAVSGKVLAAGSTTKETAAAAAKAAEEATKAAGPRNLKLYSFWRSTSSWRVRLALALKGLSYDTSSVDLQPLEGNTSELIDAELRAKNPLDQVPLLEFTDAQTGETQSLTQSLAIIEFLEEAFPNTRNVLPTDALERARARQIAEIVNSGIQPLQSIAIQRQVKTVELIGAAGQTSDVKAFSQQVIVRGLAAIEALVSKYAPAESNRFAAGTLSPSLADICLVPQVFNARRLNVDLSPYPTINAIVARCEALPAFQQAAPQNQPDASK